jgi:hypothetical protein
MPLAFTGSAQHGGGSCQVSLFPMNGNTVSADPTDWKVIHTILGGCPGTGPVATSNGQDPAGRPDGAHCTDNSQTDCSRTFQVPFDARLPSGDFVFAWTWFNKIGNREMYMNCAPITITNGASDLTFFNTLPAIFVANLPSLGTCTTAENYSLLLPNPGTSVEVFNSAADAVSVLGLGTCKAGITTIPSSSSINLTGNQPSGASAALAALSSATVAIVASVSLPTPSLSVVPVSQSPPVSFTSSCANPCPIDGIVVCLPNNMWGLCDHGCAVPQQLAAGTVCSNGAIIGRSIAVPFTA